MYMYNTEFTALEQQSLSASDLQSPQQKHPSYTPARIVVYVFISYQLTFTSSYHKTRAAAVAQSVRVGFFGEQCIF